jgi:hypothetical protein
MAGADAVTYCLACSYIGDCARRVNLPQSVPGITRVLSAFVSPSDKLVADNNGSQTNDSGTQNVSAEDL